MKTEKPMNEFPLLETSQGNIVLFHPHMPAKGPEYVAHTLGTRWIGQGPKVDAFEREFRARMRQAGPCLAVGSGTDALHLAYLLAGIGPGDEVATPLFTCTATNLPLLYIGATPRFFVPIAAFPGENMVKPSEKMPWYKGPDLLSAVDAFEKAPPKTGQPMRMPVQDVYKFTASEIGRAHV